MTANAMAEDRDRCFDAGMNDHLSKPIEPTRLVEVLARWLAGRTPPVDASPSDSVPQATQSPAGEAKDLWHSLSSIAGLDCADGLRRVMGQKDLYLSLLRSFINGQKDAVSDIRTALEAEDFSTAERLAHTLKGVCANLGITDIQQDADRVETAINGGHDAFVLLDPLEQKLAAFIAELEQYLAEPQQPHTAIAPSASPASAASERVLCQKLAALLKADDPEAVDLLCDHQATLTQALGDQAFHDVKQATENYDFQSALQILQQMAPLSPVEM